MVLDTCDVCQKPIKGGEWRDTMLRRDDRSASGESLKPVHLVCKLGALVVTPPPVKYDPTTT